MKKRVIAMLAAALLLFAANINVCCRVFVDGYCDGELYTYSAADRAERAASAAAEEIVRGSAAMPAVTRRCVLSLRPPRGQTAVLSDEILSRVRGVEKLYAVRADRRYFGVVDDRDRLEERLRANLYSSMPSAAVRARYSAQIEIEPVYGRAGSGCDSGEMALLVSGAVSAMFTDGEGSAVIG